MEVLQKIEAMIKYIEDTHKTIATAPEKISLQNFETEIANLCNELNSGSVTQVRECAQKLEELGDKLRTLEVDLRQKQIEVQAEAAKLNKNRIAATAYAKANQDENGN